MHRYKRISITILIILLTFICLFWAYHYMQDTYLERVFPQEEYIPSYDGKFAYIQLSSPKKTLCTLYISKKLMIDHTQNIYTTDMIDTDIIFNVRDIENISWGINSYDLFFESKEKGIFCYTYQNDNWIGELYLDATRTKEEHKRGYENIYYFAGDRKNENVSNTINNPAGFEEISAQISGDTIPKEFLEKLDNQLYK